MALAILTGYGPNKFLRQAQSTGLVQVFGNGEEQRDHIHVDDVAFIASKMIERRIEGPINAATGHVTTFMEIAELACKQKEGSKIVKMQRSAPMPQWLPCV